MVFIKASAHTRFIIQSEALITSILTDHQFSTGAEKAMKLQADLARLKELADEYLHTFSKLPDLSSEYSALHRSIRVDMRKLKMLENQKVRTRPRKT